MVSTGGSEALEDVTKRGAPQEFLGGARSPRPDGNMQPKASHMATGVVVTKVGGGAYGWPYQDGGGGII